MTRTILAIAVFALMGCMTESKDEVEAAPESIPSLNVWMASLDSTHHAHILFSEKRYYNPAETLDSYEGSAVWRVAPPYGAFSLYAETDRYLYEVGESCVFPDTLIIPEVGTPYYQRRRVISRWYGSQEPFNHTSGYPEACFTPYDSLIARGSILPNLYAIDSVLLVDAKGITYLDKVIYYYASAHSDSSRRAESFPYSYVAGGFLVPKPYFLGSYKYYR